MPDPDAAPAAAPPRAGRVARRSWVLLLVATAAFGGLLVARNLALFAHPVYEDGDAATNSLLVVKAKRLELAHGHYSRLGFYHPGPALLYVLAGAEWVLHDRLGVVPAEHNAHIVGQRRQPGRVGEPCACEGGVSPLTGASPTPAARQGPRTRPRV